MSIFCRPGPHVEVHTESCEKLSQAQSSQEGSLEEGARIQAGCPSPPRAATPFLSLSLNTCVGSLLVRPGTCRVRTVP